MFRINSKSGRWSVAEKRCHSEKGQGVVELAVVLPILLLFIFAIADFSILFYEYQSMEHGISEATRYGITGQQMPDPDNPGDYLSREDSMKRVMRNNNLSIVLDNSSFTFEHLNGAVWTAGSGGPGDVFKMTVNYNWKPITPLISVFLTGGQMPLRVSSTVKSEGYPTS